MTTISQLHKRINNKLALRMNEAAATHLVVDRPHADFGNADFSIGFVVQEFSLSDCVYLEFSGDNPLKKITISSTNRLLRVNYDPDGAIVKQALANTKALLPSHTAYIVIIRRGNDSEIWANGSLLSLEAGFFDTTDLFTLDRKVLIGNGENLKQNVSGTIQHVFWLDKAMSEAEIRMMWQWGGVMPRSVHHHVMAHYPLTQTSYFKADADFIAKYPAFNRGDLVAWDVVEQYNYAKNAVGELVANGDFTNGSSSWYINFGEIDFTGDQATWLSGVSTQMSQPQWNNRVGNWVKVTVKYDVVIALTGVAPYFRYNGLRGKISPASRSVGSYEYTFYTKGDVRVVFQFIHVTGGAVDNLSVVVELLPPSHAKLINFTDEEIGILFRNKQTSIFDIKTKKITLNTGLSDEFYLLRTNDLILIGTDYATYSYLILKENTTYSFGFGRNAASGSIVSLDPVNNNVNYTQNGGSINNRRQRLTNTIKDAEIHVLTSYNSSTLEFNIYLLINNIYEEVNFTGITTWADSNTNTFSYNAIGASFGAGQNQHPAKCLLAGGIWGSIKSKQDLFDIIDGNQRGTAASFILAGENQNTIFDVSGNEKKFTVYEMGTANAISGEIIEKESLLPEIRQGFNMKEDIHYLELLNFQLLSTAAKGYTIITAFVSDYNDFGNGYNIGAGNQAQQADFLLFHSVGDFDSGTCGFGGIPKTASISPFESYTFLPGSAPANSSVQIGNGGSLHKITEMAWVVNVQKGRIEYYLDGHLIRYVSSGNFSSLFESLGTLWINRSKYLKATGDKTYLKTSLFNRCLSLKELSKSYNNSLLRQPERWSQSNLLLHFTYNESDFVATDSEVKVINRAPESEALAGMLPGNFDMKVQGLRGATTSEQLADLKSNIRDIDTLR